MFAEFMNARDHQSQADVKVAHIRSHVPGYPNGLNLLLRLGIKLNSVSTLNSQYRNYHPRIICAEDAFSVTVIKLLLSTS
jgi:hypothetical protein